MDNNDRIAQWEKMCAEAPDDMAWLSLGNAYRDADRLHDAANAYAKAIELNDTMSRAYQMRGQVLIDLGQADEAADVLKRGYTTAAERGDMMPQKAIGELLEKIGQAVPQVEMKTADTQQLSENQIIDRRTGRPGSRMTAPPMRGPVGQFIADHYSQETWREWIAMGTKVINEMRLDFSNELHQKHYDDQMLEWLGFTMDEVQTHTAAKNSK